MPRLSFYRRKKRKTSPFGEQAIREQEGTAKAGKGLMGFYTDEEGTVRPITSPNGRLKVGDKVRILNHVSEPRPMRVKKGQKEEPKPEEKHEEPKEKAEEPKGEEKPEGEEKELEPTRAEKVVTRKQPEIRKMSGIEQRHLLAFCKQFDLDPQEIDVSLTYDENKDHLQELARTKGFSEEEVIGAEQQIDFITTQYEQYLGMLRTELETAGYVVSEPDLPSL